LYDAEQLQTYSSCCNKPLLARYGLLSHFSKYELQGRRNDMWRYFEMLPVFHEENIVSLGEGMTPLLQMKRWASKYEIPNLIMKDESQNPTGSFKARGLSAAISKAKELGMETCIIPTAGNAGGAMSAYCAKAGMKAIVVMPKHTPAVFKQECELYNAELILEEGLINTCAKKVAALNKEKKYFDVSTFKEPYRLEGKKTMGYEIAEQYHWQLPDVIVYPTGGGTGLVGIWKAFHEMIAMGWIENKLPKMIAVQAQNCCPIVESWEGRQVNAKNYIGQASIANGLAVPNPFAEDLIIETLYESKGTAIAISDSHMIDSVKEIAKEEGLLIAPEGAALFKALLALIEKKFIHRNEKILLLNTGTGYKYLENIM
jgi:threonine synthase